MRTLILTLIIAISFAGYSAAAHAFAGDMGLVSVTTDNTDVSKVTQDCSGDQDGKGKADMHVCLDCHHCGAAHHVASLSEHIVRFPDRSGAVFPLTVENLSGAYLFFLLRPPKTLV